MLPAIPNFAEADSSLTARLLSRFKQIDSICFQIFKGHYTPALPINSPPGVHGEKKTHEEGKHTEAKKTERRLNRDLFSCFQEFREFRELLL